MAPRTSRCGGRVPWMMIQNGQEVNMIRTVEAVVDERGQVRLLEPLLPGAPRRALVTILDEEPTELPNETALLSEAALAEAWNRPEEDAVWSYLRLETQS